jgi:CTP synthase
MTRYIFVTGGVVSSLGKGITAASVGSLLKSCGLNVGILKIDPYLNVDPGTMSPYQHGEVFVTDDGAETDLDLGHYERFMDVNLTRDSNFTSGRIYEHLITQERAGAFLGGTVQIIPHLTNEIKSRILKLGAGKDVVIVEIGGTVGDIEGLPFLEAARQLRQDVGREHVCYLHVTLIPYIRAAEELKTKPTQQSVAKLREIGIEPQILVCRTEKPLTRDLRKKLALFCDVWERAVIEELDVTTSIYEVPVMLKRQGLDTLILEMLNLRGRECTVTVWEKVLRGIQEASGTVTVAIAGKYTELKDAYKSIWEALQHAGIANGVSVRIEPVDVDKRADALAALQRADAVLVPGGFGDRGVEGKIDAVRFAREQRKPFLGICLGMQCAVIEFARNRCGLDRANSTEFDPDTPHPVVDLMEEQRAVSGKGGTMRLGAYPCTLQKDSLAYAAYRELRISERHRHRYELNNASRDTLQSHGLRITGEYEDRHLAEIVELSPAEHPWFVAVQFHPEFKSRPNRAHPLFRDFIAAAVRAARPSPAAPAPRS